MDYGSGGLFIIFFFFMMCISPIFDRASWDHGGAYEFDMKETMRQEDSRIASESFIWMNQGNE